MVNQEDSHIQKVRNIMRLNEKHIRLLKLLLNDSISLDRLSLKSIFRKSIVTYIGHLNNYFNNEMEIYKKGINLTF